MTKEQILNGMSEEDFYNLYPDQASWENAQQMKLGGLSGAPHNGQPTAKEFFSYGSHANDGINIPMGNPLYLAYGGIPMAQAGKNMTPQEWAKQEQLNLINRTGVQTPKNKGNLGAANTLFNPFANDSDVSDDQIDSSHVYPNNPNLASYFKGDKMIVGPAVNTPKAQSEAAKFNVGKIFKMKRNIFTPAEAYANYQENGGFIDYNNNTTYPTFSQGGYDYEDGGMMNNSSDNYIYNYGGSYDPGLQKYQGDKQGSQVDYGKLADLKRQEKNNNMSIEGILSSFRPGEDTTAGPMGLAREKARAYQIQLANKIKNHPDNIKKEEDGGSVINLINALTKAKKKAYGGANSQPGGNQSHIENLKSTFNKFVRDNVNNVLINEQADSIKKEYGGLMQGREGIQVNPNLYKQNSDKSPGDLREAINNMFSSSNPYNNYGMNNLPINYSYKMNDKNKDVLNQVLSNPSSRIKNVKHGLFGNTVTYGYRDQKNKPYPVQITDLQNKPMEYIPEGEDPTMGSMFEDETFQNRLPNYFPNQRGNSETKPIEDDSVTEKFNFFYDDNDGKLKLQIGDNNPVEVNNQKVQKALTPYQIEHRNDAKYNIDLEGANIPTIEEAMDNSVEGIDTAVQQMKDQGIKDEYKKDPEVDLTENINNQVIDPNNELWKNHFKKQKQESLRHLTKPASDIQNLINSKSTQQKYGGLYKAQYGVDHNSKNPKDGKYDNNGNEIVESTSGTTSLPIFGANNAVFGTTAPSSVTGNIAGNNGVYNWSQPKPPDNIFAGKPKDNSIFNTKMVETNKDELAPLLKEANTNLGNPEKNVDVKTKRKFSNTTKLDVGNTLLAGLSNSINLASDTSQDFYKNKLIGDNIFPVNQEENKGNYDINSGNFYNSKYGGYMQQGGYPQQSAQQPNQEQIVQGVAQMLQQGAQPEEIAQQLIQMGLPQEEAMQLIQAVMQQLQGSQQQQPMQYGGYSMNEDEESYEDDLTEDEIAELRNGGYNVQYI